MKFEIGEEELKKLAEWEHKCEMYTGAIGGRLSYEFTPTGLGLGVCMVVKCACGEEINITDWRYWRQIELRIYADRVRRLYGS